MKNQKLLYEEPKIELISLSLKNNLNTSGGDWRDPAELEEIED